MDKQDPVWLKIRRLRKKLRQIEHLDAIDRELTDEEITKCLQKDSIRDDLVQLLTNEAEFSYNSTTTTNEVDDEQPTLDISDSCRTDREMVDFNVAPSAFEVYANSEEDIEVEEIQLMDVERVIERSIKPTRIRSESPVAASSGSSGVAQPPPPPQPSPPKKSKKTEKSGSEHEVSPVSQQWRNSGFVVTAIQSHNDLVTAVDCHGNMFVSASRDTTIKIWDTETLHELRSLGSHTGCVTDVKLVPARYIGESGGQLGLSEDDYLILSGSLDCSVKLWAASTGELLKSIYTYNPLTKIAFHSQLSAVITVSDGGKLELFDLLTKETICSVLAHSDAITGLCGDGQKIYTSSADGDIKVYEIRDKSLHCIFVSETVKTDRGVVVMRRRVRSLAVKGDNVYYGDDGVNIKQLAWKQGLVRKISNHKEEFGMTDSLCCHGNLLLSSAYDLDTGMGYINVQEITAQPRYLASVHDDDSGRIMGITVCENPVTHCLVLITGGAQLKVWKQTKLSGVTEDIVPTRFIHRLSQPAQDSDIESDAEFTESDSDVGGGVDQSRRRVSETNSRTGFMSWCSVL